MPLIEASTVPSALANYSETPEQKKTLAQYAKEAGVTDKGALQEISNAVKGKAMSALRDAVKSYVENPV
jgi:hypothetical protein